MHPKSPKWLDDIATRCRLILEFTNGRTLADYEGNDLLRSAVERNLEIISLALLRLEQTDLATAGRLPDYSEITDLHDRLVRCFDIDGKQVWEIFKHLLPLLKTEVEPLLDEAKHA